jgi:hypothetical protein
MNPMIESGIIAAAVALAAAFVALRVIRTFRARRPACCSGGDDKPARKAACPHCEKDDQKAAVKSIRALE